MINRFMSNYGLPILIIAVGGWIVKLEQTLFDASTQSSLVIVTIAGTLFVFGISLRTKKQFKTWIKKIIVSFLLMLLVLQECGVVHIEAMSELFGFLAIGQVGHYMIYILLGWLFFD